MENTLLVGLSRQMVAGTADGCRRQQRRQRQHQRLQGRPVVVRGISDHSAPRVKTISCDQRPPRQSFVQDRATYQGLLAGSGGDTELTKNPLDISIDGKGVPRRCRPRQASATPATAACQINAIRASSSPPAAIIVLGTSGPIVFQPTDKAINIASRRHASRYIEGTVPQFDSVRGKLQARVVRRRRRSS